VYVACIFGRPVVKRSASCYRTVVCPVLSCLSATLVYCGQTVGRVKVPLDVKVGLSPNHIVLDGDPAPPHGNGHSCPPLFGPCLLWPNCRPSQQLLSSCNCCNQFEGLFTVTGSHVYMLSKWFYRKGARFLLITIILTRIQYSGGESVRRSGDKVPVGSRAKPRWRVCGRCDLQVISLLQ